MGEIGFGKSFEQAATGRSHFETEFLRHGMTMLAWVTPIPWLYHLGLALPAIPGFTKNWLDLLAWSVDQAKLKLEVPHHPWMPSSHAHFSPSHLRSPTT